MPCERIPPDGRRRRLSDLYRDLGDDLKVAWLKRHGLDRLLAPLNTRGAIICGTWRRPKPCRCGQPSGFLCDEPVSRGKTCDAPLCGACRTAVGDDLDLCPVHARRQRQLRLFDDEAGGGV